MNDLPRQKLVEIISNYGRSVCDDPKRCEGLLRDLCGQYKGEVSVLIGALRELIVSDMLTASSSIPKEVMLARFTKRLQDACAFSDEAARWAVESWALALGLISIDDVNTVSSTPDAEPVIESGEKGVSSTALVELREEDIVPYSPQLTDPPKPRRNPLGVLLFAVGLLLVAHVGFSMYQQSQEEQKKALEAQIERQRQQQARLEQEHREREAELEKQRQEQQKLEQDRREKQAALEKQREEQVRLDRKRQQQQAELEKQRQEQQKLEQDRREKQAALEKQREEQARLDRKRQQQQAELEKQRQEQERDLRTAQQLLAGRWNLSWNIGGTYQAELAMSGLVGKMRVRFYSPEVNQYIYIDQDILLSFDLNKQIVYLQGSNPVYTNTMVSCPFYAPDQLRLETRANGSITVVQTCSVAGCAPVSCRFLGTVQ